MNDRDRLRRPEHSRRTGPSSGPKAARGGAGATTRSIPARPASQLPLAVQRKESIADTGRAALPAARADTFSLVSGLDWDREAVDVQAKAEPAPLADSTAPIQRRADTGSATASGPDVHGAAAHGISGAARPLPHLDQLQQAFGPGHDLSGVRAHVGGAAAEGAQAMGATAFATGRDVAFAASPDLHTAAHEAAHVVQQQHGVQLYGGVGAAGDTYERHADAVADRVVAGRSAADLLPSTSGSRTSGDGAVQRQAAPAEDNLADVSAARFLEEATRKRADVTAREYVRAHLLPHIGPALRQHLAGEHFTLPPRLTWGDTDRALGLEVLERIDDVFGGDNFHGLPDLLAGAAPDLWTLVDQNRLITAAAERTFGEVFEGATQRVTTSKDLKTGAKGPIAWRPQVGVAIASRFHEAMTASLARVAQRYVAAFDAHAAAAGSAAHAQPVTSADLVPSAPMDRLVARVLARDAMVTVTPAGPGQSRAAEHHKTRRIKSLVWLAEPGMWNWVKVLDPADATAEEVAWHLWKDYSAAHRLEVSPPLFGLTAEDAAEFPEARQRQGIVAAGTDAARASRRLAHITGDQATTDRRGQLTHSKAGTEAARGQARAVAPDAEPATPAAAAAAPASTADAYGRVVQILDAIARQVAPMGLGTELAPIRLRAFLSLQRGDGDPAIAAASLPLVIAQERLLAQVAVPIAQLARQGRAGAAPALLDATRDLLRVVALSEHPAVAEAALTEALARQQLASVDSLEALLARATQSVGSLALNPDATRGARRDSAAEFGASLGARHQALRTRVAELRARFTAGEQVSAIEIGDLTTDVETLEVESNILALSGDLPQVIAALTTLSDKVSQIVLGDAGDQVDLAGEGRDLRERLTRIHDHWLNAHRALGKVNKWTDVNLRRELATRSLAELREELADLGGDARVATYLRTAYAAVDDGYTRDALFKIGAMIGVAVISAGAGAVIGGAVGASTVAGQVAAIATETLVNAGLSAAVTGGDFSTELVANAAATAVTLGTLSVAQKALASTRLVKTLAAVRAAGGPDGAAAALAQFALYGVTLTGAVVAGMEADSVARGQGGIGISTLPTQASHGLAMLIGQGIVQRLAHRQIESLRRLGARGREVAASYLRARRLAKRAAAHDDPAATLRAIEAERAAYAADLALHEHLLAHGDLDAAHLTERRAAAIIDENRARIADLDTAAAELAGLQPLIEGHAYRGSAAQVDAAAAQYQHRGYTLEPGTTAAGDRTVTAVSPDGATRIELVATGAAAPDAHERPTDRFPAVDESGRPAHDRTTAPMHAVDEAGRPAHERTTAKMHAVDEAGRPTHEPTTAKMHAVGEAGRHARAPDYGSVTAEALAGGYQLPGKEHGVDPEWYYYRDKRSTPGEYELAVRPEAPAGTPRLRAVVEDGAFVRLEVQKARSPATPTPIEPIADERPAPAVDGAEGVRANTPGSPAPVEPATRGRKLPEVPIRKQDFAYTAKPDGAYFRIDYKGRDVRGNEYALGHGKVRVDDVGAPMEYPEFGLHSDADGVNGERIVVRIYDDVAVELARSAPEGEPVGARGVGEPSSLTRLAIDTMVKEYDARWGHPPEALQGHLAWYNKLNFQREYFKFKSAGLSNDDAGIAAIKAISFGAARVDAGYGDFYVKCTGTERVDLGEPYGRQRVPKKIEVMAYRTKEVS